MKYNPGDFFSIIFRAALSVILLSLLFNLVDKDAILSAILKADKLYLIAAFLMLILNYGLCLLRWYILLKEFHLGVSFKKAFSAFCAGIFASLFIPSFVGIDLARGTDLSIHTKKPRQVLATILLDRLSGYAGIVILLTLVCLFTYRIIIDKTILSFLVTAYILLGLMIFVIFNKSVYLKLTGYLRNHKAGKMRESVSNIYEDIHMFRGKALLLTKILALSVLSQLILPLVFYLAALSLGLKISIVYFFIFVPLIGAIALIPLTLSGLGLRDVSTIFFFGKIGIPGAMAFSVSLLNFSFVVAAGILGGLLYVATVSYRRV